MNQKQIFNKISEIFARYQHDPKNNETIARIKKEFEQFIIDSKLNENGAVINSQLYVVDSYAICGIIFIRGSDDKRFSHPKILWSEANIEYDKDSAYEDAMGIIETR